MVHSHITGVTPRIIPSNWPPIAHLVPLPPLFDSAHRNPRLEQLRRDFSSSEKFWESTKCEIGNFRIRRSHASDCGVKVAFWKLSTSLAGDFGDSTPNTYHSRRGDRSSPRHSLASTGDLLVASPTPTWPGRAGEVPGSEPGHHRPRGVS